MRRGVRQRGNVDSLARQGDGRHPAMVQQDPDRAGGVADLRRKIDAVVLEEGDQSAAPAGGDGSGAEGVLEDQVPADDPGEDLAQGRVAVGVGRAGDGNERGEFGVAEARQRRRRRRRGCRRRRWPVRRNAPQPSR